ncbi:MAG: C1 family peptidase [Armatimonadota bacterium]|nr:C1 family peptidase [Armatimonadota bacterium]MDR7422411.1 C1 family peptidase [Armatimonadota bacterium]MDR7453956.1 C1 family peptidase [Armatimonadota bacterium]MDR7457173.1 C1 family peptidase [Armatimonadota bacterium]MDR7497905.1 C1 family peptidase [Armatimonadota bacterium]
MSVEMRRGVWWFLGTLGISLVVAVSPWVGLVDQAASATVPVRTFPARVDLTAQQTPLKNQGNRNTCITFAAIAAMEAAYRRAGYGALDLSEEFLNHMGKMGWLHPRWSELQARGSSWRETQVAAYGGGMGMVYIEQLANGLAVPQEELMPYRPEGYPRETGGRDWTDPHWNMQRNASDFNLDIRVLPIRALQAERYFSVQEHTWIYRDRRPTDPTSASEFERVLAEGREIVWDFDVNGDRSGSIWRFSSTASSEGAHSMLIVGYDRTARDPRDHYFIAKNSWGPTGNPGDFTWISYDYLRYGINAGYIRSVKAPHRWHELAFIGRWALSFDGHKGWLDIYHIPGLMQSNFRLEGVAITDRRVGSFYDATGAAYRVNGSMSANSIQFHIDWSRPNLRWDELPTSARRFDYFLFWRDADNEEKRVMAGFHRDPDGRTWAGYAHRLGHPAPLRDVPKPLRPDSYLGRWSFETMLLSGRIELTRREGNVLHGRFFPARGGPEGEVRAAVDASDPALISIAGPGFNMQGRYLSHDRGIIAGRGGRSGVPGYSHLATFGFYALYLGR